MKVSYLHISHISHYSCKIHAFSHIFFEHFHDFKTHTYVQIKIKFLKIAFLSKYCKFDIWSYSFSKLNHMNFFFFKIWSHFSLIFELDYIIFSFYEEKKCFTWKKEFHIKKKILRRYLVIRRWFVRIRIHWISLNIKHETYIILNIADYS